MQTNTPTRTLPLHGDGSGFDRGAAVTRSLLGYGVLVGPLYLAVGLAQALVRDGFDLARHPLSVLANGSGGWVQTANFVVCGSMVIAAAVGFRRVLRPQARAAAIFLGAYGVGMIAAAVFRADPVDGFPPGTPLGYPTAVSVPGMLHFAFGGLGFLSLAVSCLLIAAAMKRRSQRAMALVSLLSGTIVIGGFVAPMFLPFLGGTAGIWLAVVVGWAWLAVVSVHLYRAVPHPDCVARAV